MSKKLAMIDGNTAAAHIAYALSDVAALYPITPSSTMGEVADEWRAAGRKNIFGQTVRIMEMQSEAGAAGAVHGSLATGALTTTFTASQGLLLMIPNMYKISGELLPGVFHVSARSLAGHALSIFGDHADVMAARQTGWGLLASASPQEAMDLALVAHLTAIKSRVPFLHFFDGFRTSAEIAKVEMIDYEDIAKLVDMESLNEFRNRALNPEHPKMMGSAQNPDIYFQARERSNPYYTNLADSVEEHMKKVGNLTGRQYGLFDYYGAPDAKNIIVCMASGCDVIHETVDYLMKQGEKVGVLKVRLYRPWSDKHLIKAIPETVKKIAVLDRTKESGALGEPLYLDVCTSLLENSKKNIKIVGGRYGLSSKDFTPSMVNAVFENLKSGKSKNHFTVGIEDDVTNSSLPIKKTIITESPNTIRCKFWGLGSDGTVGANKNSIKIIGDHTDGYAQGYFAYDSKKSGGITISHLRFGPEKIRSSYFVNQADFIACHNQSYITRYDILDGIKEGGDFLLNCIWSAEELDEKLPAAMKKTIASKKINFYIINAYKIAEELGLGNRINMILQAAFFKITKVIADFEQVRGYMKHAVKKTYGKKGDEVVKMNNDAIDRGADAYLKVEVPEKWAKLKITADSIQYPNDFVRDILVPINSQKGDTIKVSKFTPDGSFPTGTTKYEKRGIAVKVPCWASENCIQCNQCAYVCPHAVIRPYLINEDETKSLPQGTPVLKAIGKGFENLNYKIQISPLDCTGCGSCADVCPAPKGKALIMKPLEEVIEQESKQYTYLNELPVRDNLMDKYTLKGSQFKQPLFEFSGACAGCGETPYIKLVTQLYGDRMVVANATGCSSIYGGSAPVCPYTFNKSGSGPAWANSLFEDNAEYGLGMSLGITQRRLKLAELINEAKNSNSISAELKDLFIKWLEEGQNADRSSELSGAIKKILPETIKSVNDQTLKNLLIKINENSDMLTKKSVWIIGGDGWAYDIGYGGLDHVVATNNDVNILVLDTEVYSNTGGQASKASQTGQIAKFAATGKEQRKKDLGLMLTTYGYVYVASVSIGANKNHYLKVLKEAEAYPGPSVIICYAPCINHGINMTHSINEEKLAVECGYWPLYIYNPLLKNEGKNPFVFESKEPNGKFQEFLMSEVRYSSLSKQFPEIAKTLFAKAEKDMLERFKYYKKLAALSFEDFK
ncbi:pyruvate:ferredoxin (flavodoxin) oxidoreductase [Candidatus Dependentiae bacterium]|nr:pyruvate:ferredoxin (flavodoxin) oxidoreductase [Candidatus Dependentiae bacterium]